MEEIRNEINQEVKEVQEEFYKSGSVQYIDSKEVAEIVGKKHTDLIRDIKRYRDQLSKVDPKRKIAFSDFFIESSYSVEGQSRKYPCYLVTRKGCEFIAHKLTGIKGTKFTATYINRFNEDEKESKYLNTIERRKTMDNKVSVFKNEDLNLEMRTILNEDGSISVNLTDAAKGLGFTRIAKSGNEVIRWERVEGYLKVLGVPTCGHDDYIPESLFYMLAMKANNEQAQRFQRWIAIDVVPAIRKTGSYGEISEKVRTFMEKQIQFNQEVLQKFNDLQAGQSKNFTADSITACVKDESESAKRIKMLNNLVAKMAKACGWEKRFAFHRLYKTLEEVLDISAG